MGNQNTYSFNTIEIQHPPANIWKHINDTELSKQIEQLGYDLLF